MGDSFFIVIIILFIWILDLQSKLNRLINDFEQLRKNYNEKISSILSQQRRKKEDTNESQSDSSCSANEEQTIIEEQCDKQNSSEEFLNKTKATNKEPESNEKTINKTKEPISFIQIFSWIGGFILILGIIFGIKYTLENNLISLTLRVALGTLLGVVMWFTGILLKEPKIKTTSDTLCACGLCTCYSIWFAAYYFYNIVSINIAFAILTIISLISFATAVWKNSQYIGILAQIVGFCTPVLFNVENQNIWFLLVYVGLINAAAISAAIKRNWTNQLFISLFFTLLSFIAILNVSNILQLAAFATIFALLYTIIASKYNQTKLLSYSFLFSLIDLLVIGIKSFLNKQESLPYLIIYSGLISIVFGLISYWQKKEKLCLGAFIFSFVAFMFIAVTKSFSSLLLSFNFYLR